MTDPAALAGLGDALIDEVSALRRAAGGGADLPVDTIRAGDTTTAELAELLSPSLFAEDRVVVELSPYDLSRGRIVYRR